MELSGLPALIAIFLTIATPVVLIALVVSHTSRLVHRQRQRLDTTIVAEYDAPAGLTPAEVGYLFDSRFGRQEMVATLLDLEQKGMVRISHGQFDGLNIQRVDTKPLDSLKPHERYLLGHVETNTTLAAMSFGVLAGFRSTVRRSLADQGLIKQGTEVLNYYLRRLLITFLILTVPIMTWLVVISGHKPDDLLTLFVIFLFFVAPVFLILTIVVGGLYNRIVGQPGIWTAQLKQLFPEIQGYRDYIEQVELDELQFDSADLKQQSKNKALPYAVALGLNTEWRQRFDHP
ncbi:MAG: hypothetical protein JWN38_64 [Candidatus Saccharibacteria bacterium]|nr:hypothetical protein [Candidatus Saccharibacteria bacterium]